jgi:hypothetical protein
MFLGPQGAWLRLESSNRPAVAKATFSATTKVLSNLRLLPPTRSSTISWFSLIVAIKTHVQDLDRVSTNHKTQDFGRCSALLLPFSRGLWPVIVLV